MYSFHQYLSDLKLPRCKWTKNLTYYLRSSDITAPCIVLYDASPAIDTILFALRRRVIVQRLDGFTGAFSLVEVQDLSS